MPLIYIHTKLCDIESSCKSYLISVVFGRICEALQIRDILGTVLWKILALFVLAYLFSLILIIIINLFYILSIYWVSSVQQEIKPGTEKYKWEQERWGHCPYDDCNPAGDEQCYILTCWHREEMG